MVSHRIDPKDQQLFIDLVNRFSFPAIAAIFVAMINAADKEFIAKDTMCITFKQHMENFLEEIKPKGDA